MKYLFMVWVLSLLVWSCQGGSIKDEEEEYDSQVCVWDQRENGMSFCRDKHLKEMKFDLGETEETELVYVTPDVATFYNATPGTKSAQRPKFTGRFAKFINLSSDVLVVYWHPDDGREDLLLAGIDAFGSAATASFPGHNFVVRPKRNPKLILHKWEVRPTNALYVYNPIGDIEDAAKILTDQQLDLFKLQYNSLKFSQLYHRITGRQYIALYGRKHPPRYFMWPADYFGQTFQITTKETHYVELPPVDELPKLPRVHTNENRNFLGEYRTPNQETMTMTMTVLSCAPRVFEIKNFLSLAEVDHLMELATGVRLAKSTTKATSAEGGVSQVSDETRTSRNSWLARDLSAITDSIYRRAADLLQIDEVYFRTRHGPNETMLVPESRSPISERLQLVHYDVGQQYTPHHDFAMPNLAHGQPSRFATVLFYLNEGMKGGETAFPHWLNAETNEALKVTPEIGKAILFYNQLPDGNYDELSQHAAMPVIEGEKWLTNLWVWDPYLH